MVGLINKKGGEIMEIKALASSSKGNCYIIDDGNTSIMIEAGIPIQRMKEELKFNLPKHAIISHSHMDHAKAVNDLLKNGIECYMSTETAIEINAHEHYRTHFIEHLQQFEIGSFIIKPLEMKHDVKCLGFLIYSKTLKETLFFATDTYYIPYQIQADHIMVEANYSMKYLNDDMTQAMKSRLDRSHTELNTVIDWMKKQDRKQWKQIYLLHLSGGHSNAEEFKNKVIKETGKMVHVCGE